MIDLSKLFQEFASLKVGIIGDVMLDTYIWGQVERISPEAPVPVVSLDKKEYRIGGAGNVALNCQALGATVSLLSVCGPDEEGVVLKDLLKQNKVNTTYLHNSSKRLTTNKTRIISRNQQMMRLDAEHTEDLNETETNAFLRKIEKYITTQKPDILIFEDYNKGVLTKKIIEKTIGLCKKYKVLTAVDPKRKNFFAFKQADIFKPNLKEVKEGLHLLTEEVSLPILKKIHQQLKKELQHDISFITLSAKGVFYQQGNTADIYASYMRNIADVSGAGDTVIAVGAMVYAITKNVRLMAEIANIAGGLVCEEVGTVAIHREKLLEECKLLLV
ncbi:MAG: carbohydrate kinase [Chitinophagaceae bacterium]|nr:carbohydrate kinase [Chitinophagaceae bacterium]